MTNCSRPDWTSSPIDSMSAVMRDDEHAGLVAVEERHRLALDVVEHPDAQDA